MVKVAMMDILPHFLRLWSIAYVFRALVYSIRIKAGLLLQAIQGNAVATGIFNAP